MVNAAAIDTGSAGLARFAQASSAVVALSSSEAPAAAPRAAVVNLAEQLRYNSFEFSYRQDFGKIVLLRQEPETGELVQQFPSEYYLKKYAATERVQRAAREAANDSGSSGGDVDVASSGSSGTPASQAVSGEAGGTTGGDIAVPSAPALPSGGTSAPALPSGSASAPRVNITV